jgi:hypothetical protein
MEGKRVDKELAKEFFLTALIILKARNLINLHKSVKARFIVCF